MKKNLLYTALGLMGLMGTLAIGVVNAQEINKDIVIEATATEADQTIKINKYFANAYTVDWGDGSPVQDLTRDTVHTYSVASGYTIKLSLPHYSARWTFGNNLMFPLVPKNGTTMTGVKITYMPSLSEGFGNSSETPGNNFFGAFNRDGKIISLPEGSFDTSKIINVGENFFYSFNQYGDLVDLPTGSFRFSSGLTTVGNYFFAAFNLGGNLLKLPEGSFDTSYITIVHNGFFIVFNLFGKLKELPMKSFNISNISFVENQFFDEFNRLGALESLPEKSFRLSTGLTQVGSAFFSLFNMDGQLKSLPEGSFDTSNITEVGGSFFTLFNSGGTLTNLPDSFTLNSVGISNNGYPNAFNSPNYTLNKKVSDLISGVVIPSGDIDAFSDNQPGRCGVHPNWLVNPENACSIIYEANGGTGTTTGGYMSNATGVEVGSGITLPTREGYTLSGWQDSSGNIVDEIIFPDMDGQTLYAKREANEYTITYELDGGVNNSKNVTGYTIEDTVIFANPTKEGFTFDGWFTDAQFTTGITSISTGTTGHITVYAKWTENKKSSGSSGGGGRGSSKTSDIQDSSTSSQNDKNTENVIQSDPEHSEWGSEESSNTPMDSSDKSSEGQEILSPSDSSFTKERKDAYTFAHEKGITTMPTIQEAQMDGKLTRIAMAKMLSQYAMNVLGQKPENIVTPKFNDVTDKQNSDYDDGVTLAYQLGIMGQNMPNNKFRPNDEVTRAEFATALSRMLYHTSDGEYKSTDKYYTNHMKKLVQEKIITNDDAKMKELRGYVMIMLMRSAK